jgi:flagellar biosynthetic protein FliR
VDIQLFSLTQIQIFFVILSRIAGFIGAAPVISSTQNPMMVKVSLTLVITICLFPLLQNEVLPQSFAPVPLAMLVLSEVLVGALLGLIAQFIFVAVEFGATIVGFQMGFSAANVYDPTNKTQVALVSQFQNVFAMLIFLCLNGHYIFFRALLRSFTLLPPGKFDVSGDAVPYLMKLTSHMFTLGVQFSAPVLAVLLLTGLILGILARIFPQLNVFMLSFPINVGAALISIAFTLDMSGLLIARELEELGSRILNMLDLLNP